MSIGEPHSARLARERLKAIKKYLPVRDSVKQQLQSRQEYQMEFSEGAEQLFKPIVEPTKKIITATEATQRALATLPADIAGRIQAAQPAAAAQPEGAEALAPEPKSVDPIINTELLNKFDEVTSKTINNIENLQQLAEFEQQAG